jgi:uncharacterized protein YdaU (DUF1376 family)
MSGDPWFKFYPSDWISGVSGLSAAERGVYVTLLASIYDAGGPIRRDDARLARVCGLPKFGFTRALAALTALGKVVECDGMLFNERAKRQLTEREFRSLSASKGAQVTNAKKAAKTTDGFRSSGRSSGRSDGATCARIPEPELERQKTTTPKIIDNPETLLVASPPAPTKAKREKPKTRIAADAQPTKDDLLAASRHGMPPEDVRAEWQTFRAHHHAKGSQMASWSSAWVTWCLNAEKFRRSSPRAGPNARPYGEGKGEGFSAILKEMHENEQNEQNEQQNGGADRPFRRLSLVSTGEG